MIGISQQSAEFSFSSPYRSIHVYCGLGIRRIFIFRFVLFRQCLEKPVGEISNSLAHPHFALSTYCKVSEGPLDVIFCKIERRLAKLGWHMAGWSSSPINWSESISNSRSRGCAESSVLEKTVKALEHWLMARRARRSGRIVG